MIKIRKMAISVFLVAVFLVAVFLCVSVLFVKSSNFVFAEERAGSFACKQTDIESLRKLHLSDVTNRLKVGQGLETISSDLITRLNSRLTSNQLDTSRLIKIFTNFKLNLESFRTKYIDYDNYFDHILRKGCEGSSEDFLLSISDLKKKRREVHEVLLKIYNILDEYKNEVNKIEYETTKKKR